MDLELFINMCGAFVSLLVLIFGVFLMWTVFSLSESDCQFYAQSLGYDYAYSDLFQPNNCVIDGVVVNHKNFEQLLLKEED